MADQHLLTDLGRGERLADAYARSEPAWEARPSYTCGGENAWPGWEPCAGAVQLAAWDGAFVQVRTGDAGPLAAPPGG